MSDRYQPPQDQPEYQQGLYQDLQYNQHMAQPSAPQGQPQYGPGPQPPFSPQDQPPYNPPLGQPPYGPPPGPPPYGPPPGGFSQYGGQHPDARGGSGLAISALVLGILALLLCWVPIVNNFAAILAVVGLGIGIPALVLARRGKRPGAGLATASVILSGLALIGVLATQAFYSAVINDVANDLQHSAPGRPSSNRTGEAAGETPAPPAVLALGQPGQLRDYTVTVDSVTLNANDIVAKENRFNSPPTGQYVLVGLTVTYTGADEGTPWIDLSTEFIGTDSRKYDASSCSAVVPNEASELPTLLTGGTGSFQLCLDVPAAAIQGGQVEVSKSFSFDDVSAVWAIQ